MDLHYNAFISYRHHPEDIKVAETIHRALERYKVPKALKKQGKTIDRIFRDKEELPITSSLTDTITMALRNSDYQIVICSTHLKDSYWVQREIETFLQTHSKDKVLTVLVDGDNPYDVIPEILTYEDVVDPTTGETFREPIEPLSCDWRLPKRKAMKTELPRLAAVLLGCTYDDLIQRQKQYRQRRLITGASIGMAASLALAGYFLYTSIQIQENLNQALRNQSQFLASSSQTCFDEGDRLTAIALALEALPIEDERPYVAAAERALNKAMMSYSADSEIISVAAFNSENSVSDFAVTDDGKTLYILDDQDYVSAWDTDNQKKLSHTYFGAGMDTRLLTSNSGCLIALGGEDNATLKCLSKDGEIRWKMDTVEDCAFCSGKNTLLALRAQRDDDWGLVEYYELWYLDPETGESLREAPVIISNDILSLPKFSADTYYEDRPVTFTSYKNSMQHVLVCHPETGTVEPVLTHDALFYGSFVTEDNLLYVLVTENDDISNGSWYNYYFHTKSGAYLYCFDMNTHRQKWRTHITSYNYSEATTIAPIPNTDRLFCQHGSAFLQLDAKTGKILEECHSTIIPLTIQMRDSSAWVLFNNGCAGSYTFHNNQLGYIQYMDFTLTKGLSNGGMYVLPQLGFSVLLYRTTNDDSYQAFVGEYDDYIGELSAHGDLMATIDLENINLFDQSENRLLWSQERGDSRYLLGFSNDGTKLYAYRYSNITEHDTATGTSSQWELLPKETYGDYSMYYDCMGFGDNTLCTMVYSFAEKDAYIVFADAATHETQMFPFAKAEESTGWTEYGTTPLIMEITDSQVLIFAGTSTLYRYDRSTNEVTVLSDTCAKDYVYLIDADHDRMYFRVDEGILVTDSLGAELMTIPLTDLFPVSLFAYEDLLLMLGSDGETHRYDLDGNHLGSTTSSLYSNFYGDTNHINSESVPVSWAVTPDNELVVNIFGMGNIINTEEWERTGTVPHLVHYHPDSDSYICQANDMIYSYKRHTLEETKELAKATLKDFTLSEDQRVAYGLN